MSFQENLIRARKARGMTQEELAEKAGITSVGISKIETGKTWPKKETIEKFLEILEVKSFQLFTETKEDFLKYKNIVTETISSLVEPKTCFIPQKYKK